MRPAAIVPHLAVGLMDDAALGGDDVLLTVLQQGVGGGGGGGGVGGWGGGQTPTRWHVSRVGCGSYHLAIL